MAKEDKTQPAAPEGPQVEYVEVCVRDGMRAHLGTGAADARVYDGDFRYPQTHEQAGEREVVTLPVASVYREDGKPASALMLPNGQDLPALSPSEAKKHHAAWRESVKSRLKPRKRGQAPSATFAEPGAPTVQ